MQRMMKYCTNCGNKLGEGAKFCTNCGKPVKAAAKRKEFKTYYGRRIDYSIYNNVRLVSKQSQHKVHIAVTVIDIIITIYLLIVLLLIAGSSDAVILNLIIRGASVPILISIICGIILRKIRHDIIHALPKGFDYWQLRRLLKWQIFGFNNLKIGVLRLLHGNGINYPELGFGTDDEGNYYAFAVAGEDVDKYPFYTGA